MSIGSMVYLIFGLLVFFAVLWYAVRMGNRYLRAQHEIARQKYEQSRRLIESVNRSAAALGDLVVGLRRLADSTEKAADVMVRLTQDNIAPARRAYVSAHPEEFAEPVPAHGSEGDLPRESEILSTSAHYPVKNNGDFCECSCGKSWRGGSARDALALHLTFTK